MAMTARIDLTGKRFGKLVVIKAAPSSPKGQSKWICRCDCGKESNVFTLNLVRKATRSCGCQQGAGRRKHGHYNSITYKTWEAIIQRCHNSRNPGYRWYGARGVKVCKRWRGTRGFQNFLVDMGERPPGLTIERKNNWRGYCPSNCRWATWKEQYKNKRRKGTIDGRTR